MIRSEIETTYLDDMIQESGRKVDPVRDTEIVRLVAINLEMAVRNLLRTNPPPDCLVLSADICSHRLVAFPTTDGEVSVLVYES